MEATFNIIIDRPLDEVLSSLTFMEAGDIPGAMAGSRGLSL